MTRLRVMALCSFVGFFPISAAAQTPQAPVEKSAATVNAGMGWTGDLKFENNTLIPGVSAGFDWPIGIGQWVAFEGSYHWHKYGPIVERSVPRIPEIKRYDASIAVRVGPSSGNGPFFQVGAGVVTQRLSGIDESRNTARFALDPSFWVGPGAGVDLRITNRFAVRALAEVMLFPTTPKSQFSSGRLRVALVYRLLKKAHRGRTSSNNQ